MGIGITLKTILRERGMTIKRLAELADVPLNTLYSITKRDSERVDPVILERLASALKMDPYALADFDTASKMLEDRANVRERLDAAFGRLNDAGQGKVADTAEDLAGNPKYQRQEAGETASAPPEGRDTAPGEKPPEVPPKNH